MTNLDNILKQAKETGDFSLAVQYLRESSEELIRKQEEELANYDARMKEANEELENAKSQLFNHKVPNFLDFC